MTQLAMGIVNPLSQFFGNDGLPLAGGRVLTYAAGTTTPQLTYKDALLTVPNAVSVALDADGKAVIYLQALAYKIDVQDANGVSIDGYPQDFIGGLLFPSVTVPVPIAQGGTGLTAIPANGQLLIGNGVGYTLAVLTAGAGLGITNGAGTITLTPTLSVLDKSTTEQTVVSTNAPVSIYAPIIPGGTLGTAKIVRVTVTGYYQNTSGGNSNLTFTVTYGATTILSGIITTFATGTTGAVEIVITLNANGATGSQRCVVRVTMIPSASATTVGAISQSGLSGVAWQDAIAEDSTASKTLTVSVTHSVAASSVIFKAWARMTEVLG